MAVGLAGNMADGDGWRDAAVRYMEGETMRISPKHVLAWLGKAQELQLSLTTRG